MKNILYEKMLKCKNNALVSKVLKRTNALVDNVTSCINLSVLAKISLILIAISCLNYFVEYTRVDGNVPIWEREYEFSFYIPKIAVLKPMLYNLLPYILLTLFLGRNCKKIKIHIILIIILGFIAICEIPDALRYVDFYYSKILTMITFLNVIFAIFFGVLCVGTIYCLKKYSNDLDASILIPAIFILIAYSFITSSMLDANNYYYLSINSNEVARCGVSLFLSVLFVLAFFRALNGLKSKVLVVVPLIIVAVLEAVYLFNFFGDIKGLFDDRKYLYLLTYPAQIVGEFTLYITLLLFTIKNKLPDVMSVIFKKRCLTSTKQLKLLNKKLELQIITKEEYDIKRAEILKNI